MAAKRHIIIGDGAAGTTAAQALRASDPSATIAILSDDPHAAYFRAALTNYLLGELREEQIWAVPPSFYDENRIHRALVRVGQVDTKRGLVWLGQGGRPIPYDSLVLASGSRARPPTFDGYWLPGVMTMRTLHDVHRVMDLIKLGNLRTAVVVGGGPLALEWAHGLSHRGVRVTMVVREQRFLPGAIDAVASDLLLARLRHAGVDVRMGDEVTAAVPSPQKRVGGVVLRSGHRVGCELIAVAIGVICNSEFLQGSGVTLAKNGGIQVDDHMRTNVPSVFAAGDVAAFEGKLLQLWEPARLQARIAAANIAGRDERYKPGVHYMATRLYDLDCASIGQVAETQPGIQELVDFPQRTGSISYRKVCIKDDRVIGALLFGEREAHVRRFGRALKRLVDTGASVAAIKDELLDPAFDLAAWLQKNQLTEKPSKNRVGTLASAAKMRGTSAIRLTDLPPLPGMGAPKVEEAAPVFSDAPPPAVFLEGPPGRIQVQGTNAILGRDPRSPIPLQDPGVSYTHAEIVIAGQSVYVRDLGSATGTWVNGAPVTAPKALRDGDRLRVGSTELVVRLQTSDGARMSMAAPSQQRTGEPKPHLDVRTGRSLGLGFELVRSPVTIGRDPSATIRLDDESIDWQHASLRAGANGAWEIVDAESHGVTKKNGAVLPPGQWFPIESGDVIELGDVVIVYAIRPPDAHAGLFAPASVAYDSAGRPSALPPPQSPSQMPPPRAPSQVPPAYTPSAYPPPPMHATVPPGFQVRAAVRGRISIRHGPGQGAFAELGDLTIIGSQPGQASLVVADPRLGPRHVEITRLADGFYARDLGTTWGTQCRGQRLGAQPFKLANGDELVLGPAIVLRFEASA